MVREGKKKAGRERRSSPKGSRDDSRDHAPIDDAIELKETGNEGPFQIVSRRDFVQEGITFLALAGLAGLGLRALKRPATGPGPTLRPLEGPPSPVPGDGASGPSPGGTPVPGLQEASFYVQAAGGKVACDLCPHGCVLSPGQRGICRVRENHNGHLYTHGYGNPCSVHIDPIEKKPLLHFLPTTTAFSIAIGGCNFRCLNCQNWEISQRTPEAVEQGKLSPTEVAELAKRDGCASVAYTYSEPSSWYEYMLDSGIATRALGMRNVWVTNGYLNNRPLNELCKVLDGANVDLKAFSEKKYDELCSGSLQPVKDTLVTLREQGVWVEVTTLLVPGYTDDMDMLRDMCTWIVKALGPDVPHHISRFHPDYKLDHLPWTPMKILKEAREIARDAGEHYSYVGNIAPSSDIPDPETTYCPSCGRTVIERTGFVVTSFELEGGSCPKCGESIAGVWA